MSKERLSKLQGWILQKAFDTMVERMKQGDAVKLYIYREEIYSGYFGFNRRENSTYPTKLTATVSRTLKNLEKKGYIDRYLRPRKCVILFSDWLWEKAMDILREEAKWQKEERLIVSKEN